MPKARPIDIKALMTPAVKEAYFARVNNVEAWGVDGTRCCEWLRDVQSAAMVEKSCFTVDGRTYLSHRVAYQLHYGDIPNGAAVSRTCSAYNVCVNPLHLKVASPFEVSRRRRVVKSPMTRTKVKSIRKLYRNGASRKSLAAKFNTTYSTIKLIIKRTTWKHVSDDETSDTSDDGENDVASTLADGLRHE